MFTPSRVEGTESLICLIYVFKLPLSDEILCIKSRLTVSRLEDFRFVRINLRRETRLTLRCEHHHILNMLILAPPRHKRYCFNIDADPLQWCWNIAPLFSKLPPNRTLVLYEKSQQLPGNISLIDYETRVIHPNASEASVEVCCRKTGLTAAPGSLWSGRKYLLLPSGVSSLLRVDALTFAIATFDHVIPSDVSIVTDLRPHPPLTGGIRGSQGSAPTHLCVLCVA